MTRRSRFITAFVATICIDVAANAAPYIGTRGAYQRDGQEIAGFPFAFHKIGGDCFPRECETYNFHAGYFAANIAIGLALAIALGLAAASSRKDRRSAA